MKKRGMVLFIVLLCILFSYTVFSSSNSCPDTNNDGKVDILDLSFVGLYVGGDCNFDESSDVNDDCVIDETDLKLVAQNLDCEEKCYGDVNNDGKVDTKDLAFVGMHVNGTCEYDEFADINNDGKIDDVDLSLVGDNYGCEGQCEGDANSDGKVDIFDLGRVGLFYGAKSGGKTTYNQFADVNGDCVINETDLGIVGENKGCEGDCKGDTNKDGKVDIIDLAFIGLHFGTKCYNRAADINKDCSVDKVDLEIVRKNYGCVIKECGGDVNDDNIVDIKDLAKIGLNYGTRCYNETADVNDDCKIDEEDLALIEKWYGKDCEEEVKECTDSDGGKNYYVKGKVTDTNGEIYIDKCKDENLLYEWSCLLETNESGLTIYMCPNGCTDGICIESLECNPDQKKDNWCVGDKIYGQKCVDGQWKDFVEIDCSLVGESCEDGKCVELEFCPNGCAYEDKCYPIRERMYTEELGGDVYCSIEKNIEKQKEIGEKCQNNYECKSNECSDGKCISTYNLLQKIWNWLKKLFGIE